MTDKKTRPRATAADARRQRIVVPATKEVRLRALHLDRYRHGSQGRPACLRYSNDPVCPATASPVAVIAIAFVRTRPDAEVATRLDAEVAAPLARSDTEVTTRPVAEDDVGTAMMAPMSALMVAPGVRRSRHYRCDRK